MLSPSSDQPWTHKAFRNTSQQFVLIDSFIISNLAHCEYYFAIEIIGQQSTSDGLTSWHQYVWINISNRADIQWMNVLFWQVEVERRNNFIYTKVFEGLACESFNNLILWVQYKFSTTREEVRLDFKGVALTLYLLATIVIKCFILQPWINCAGNLFKYRWT